MPDEEGGTQQGAVETVGKGEQTGIAPQIGPELMEGEEALLGLAEKDVVGLYVGEHHGIVYMMYLLAVLVHLLAKEDVLETVGADAFVERYLEHRITAHHEIGGAEGTVGMLRALGSGVTGLLVHLVAVAQVAALQGVTGRDGYAAVDDGSGGVVLSIEVGADEVGGGNGDIGVEEQQPVVAGLPGQEVTDGGTTNILVPLYITAAGMLADLPAQLCQRAVGGAVVSHDDLVAEDVA